MAEGRGRGATPRTGARAAGEGARGRRVLPTGLPWRAPRVTPTPGAWRTHLPWAEGRRSGLGGTAPAPVHTAVEACAEPLLQLAALAPPRAQTRVDRIGEREP